MKVKSESEVAQSCPTPGDPMDCSPPGSSVHGVFQARVLEWGATAFSDPKLHPSIFSAYYGKHHLSTPLYPHLQFVFSKIYFKLKDNCFTILCWFLPFSSVQFSHSVVSDSLRPHESQHARPPCPSPTPRVHSHSCPSSRWCHPAVSSSVIPFSSCPQSLPASESFPMSQLFAWGDQSTGVSASASFLPKNTQGWSPLEWTGFCYTLT